MGIYERDYVRMGPRSESGLGSLRFVSFNTWLIVANVAVFLLTATLLQAPAVQRPLMFAAEFDAGVSKAQKERGLVITDVFDPRQRGSQLLPVFDPQPMVDPSGRPLTDPRGQPILKQIGVQRALAVPFTDYWGHFSTAKGFIPGLEVWRFVTFQFLHANFLHLAFNMIGLWFVGGLVEQYLGSKRYAAFYLTCGIFGAVLYLLLNLTGNLFPNAKIPGLLFDDTHTPLVGASAGIFGVLMAAAFIAPKARVAILGIIPMRMAHAVYLFTAISAASLIFGRSNAGGEAAHMGGAIAGFFFIRRAHLLRDFFDIFGDSRGKRGAPSKVVRLRAALLGPAVPDEAEVNRVLDKVRVEGLGSLSENEKRLLRRATEAGRGRT